MGEWPLFVAFGFVATAVYLSLAVYVATRLPRRSISWLIALFCLGIAIYYLTSFFLWPGDRPVPEKIPLALRVKWASLTMLPMLYLHLVSNYFSPRWRRRRLFWVVPLYAIHGALAISALLTNRLIAGVLVRTPPHILGPEPGVLLYVFCGMLVGELLLVFVGLRVSCRNSAASAIRGQIIFLIGLTIQIVIYALLSLALILIGLQLIWDTVVQGAFIGKPLAVGKLLKSTGIGMMGVAAMFLTTSLDRWLLTSTGIGFPLSTSLFVLAVIVAFPMIARWMTLLDTFSMVNAQALAVKQPVKSALAERLEAIVAHSPLVIRVLGPLEIYRFGEMVPDSEWGRERARAMLAYFIYRDRVSLTREELCAALWPERTQEESANVFHVTLHRLRRILEPGARHAQDSTCILYEGGRYRLNITSPRWLDSEAFTELIEEGSRASLEQAVQLYRGAFLSDLQWVLPAEANIQIRTFELKYIQALRTLSAQTDGLASIAYLEKLLTVEPGDENTRLEILLRYLTLGRRDLALRQVVQWRQALDELGIEPAQDVIALWQRVEQSRSGSPGGVIHE